MFHRIFAGYFDVTNVTSSRTLTVTRPIDLEIVQQIADEFTLVGDGKTFSIGDDTMEVRDGYVDFPWLSPGVNHRAVEFMLRLKEKTGCTFVDLGHCEIVGADVLRESIGVNNDTS